MPDNFYPLASTTWGDEEYEALNRVIASGKFTMGKEVSSFEKLFASYFGSRYCVMVNSGSSANLLAVAALFFRKENHLNPGDEIIVPAVSWSTTYMPLQQYGLKVRFVDIDRDTLNLDTEKLEEAITENTKAIFAVNLLGNPNDFNRIKEISGDRNLLLLEDNCEAMGARYNGKYTGTFGLMGTFSSFFSHHISTMEGGMILTDDEELYHILLSLRSHGWTRHLPEKNKVTGIKSKDAFQESFKFVLPGYNLRPLELSGAVGMEQLKKLESFVEIRRKNAEIFQTFLSDIPEITIQKETDKSSWFGFALTVDGHRYQREKILKEFEKHGIETRPVVSGNFLKNEALKYFNYSIGSEMTNAKNLDKNSFFIGNHHYDLSDQIKTVSEILLNV